MAHRIQIPQRQKKMRGKQIDESKHLMLSVDRSVQAIKLRAVHFCHGSV